MYSYAKKIAKLCQYVKLVKYIKYILVYMELLHLINPVLVIVTWLVANQSEYSRSHASWLYHNSHAL